MKPIKFKEANVVYAKDQPEYKQLPGCKLDTPEGHFVTCWKMSFIERVRILFTGKMWACILTFDRPLSPCLFSTKKSDLIQTVKTK